MQVDILGELDPDVAWDGSSLYEPEDFEPDQPIPTRLRGSAATARGNPEQGWRMLRDPLGINKLFWGRAAQDHLLLAARPHWLVQAGIPFESIRAFPRGMVLDFRGIDSRVSSLTPETWSRRTGAVNPDAADLSTAARQIRRCLDDYLAAIATGLPSRKVFVCLSGGLDSTGISILVRDHFPEATFVSFDLVGRGQAPSDDRRTARRIATDFRVPLLEVDARLQRLLEFLDLVLLEGIDWRGFNVHAALVNAALAASISESLPRVDGERSPLIVTGDLANEFLADYAPEKVAGVVHYALPDLPAVELRRTLVSGLDTSHREVGIFGAWGLTTVQPYAAAADLYLSLSGEFLATPDRKQQLSSKVFGPMLPSYVLGRTKVRAQVGGPGGGVLAACIERGIDDVWLRSRFAQLHGTNVRSLDRFIRAGRYRSALPVLPLEIAGAG